MTAKQILEKRFKETNPLYYALAVDQLFDKTPPRCQPSRR